MTDRNTIRENIAKAVEAANQFNEIGEEVIDAPDRADLREFAERMLALQNELQEILTLIKPGSPVALDEIVDAISRAVYAQPAKFRMTPAPKSKDE